MKKQEVRGADYSDSWLHRYFDRIAGVRWSTTEKVPESIKKLAAEFAVMNPKPRTDDFRRYIDESVLISRGWDHPYDHELMLTSALKAFYVVTWLEFIQEKTGIAEVNIRDAVRVSLTPIFSSENDGAGDED